MLRFCLRPFLPTVFVVMTKTATQALDCRPLDKPGAVWRLDASREVRCSLSEGWWLRICILGAGILATMTLAVPVLLFRHLWKKQRRVIFASSKGVQVVAEAYEVETADDEAKKAPTADAEVPSQADVAVEKRSLRLAPLREPSRPKRPPKPKAKAVRTFGATPRAVL